MWNQTFTGSRSLLETSAIFSAVGTNGDATAQKSSATDEKRSFFVGEGSPLQHAKVRTQSYKTNKKMPCAVPADVRYVGTENFTYVHFLD